MISVNQLLMIRESLNALKSDFENSMDYLNSIPKYEVIEVFKERETKWRDLFAVLYESICSQMNMSKDLLLDKINDGSIYIDKEENKDEIILPDLSTNELFEFKVTWKRLENSTIPYMFEPVGNSWGWIPYRQSKCFDPNYKPYFKDESLGMGAFREAIKRGYKVVKSEGN